MTYFKEIFVFITGVLAMVLTGLLVMNWSPEYIQQFDRQTRNWIRQLQQPPHETPKPCEPVTNIVLLKTHKTGGSTLQNIMYRFGDKRNLTFALPAEKNYFGTPKVFDPSTVLKLPGATKYNILANHARYCTKGFEKLMPRDTVYITSIRHPANQFESMYKYYELSDRFHAGIKTFAKNPTKYYSKSKFSTSESLRQSGVNPMLFDLGLQKRYLQDMNRIKHKVKNLEQNFNFILIAEYFDESLVLLKDLLCWSLEDVAYFKINARVEGEVVELEEDTRHNLTLWNEGDMLLYTYFNDTLWRKIGEYGHQRLKVEVTKLGKIMRRWKNKCLMAGNSTKEATGGKTKVLGYQTRKSANSWEDEVLCKSLTRKPMEYLGYLKDKMKSMFG